MYVTVPFRSLNTSLFITITNAIIELGCLSAMLVIIAANECRRLRRGEAVNIRTHCFNVRLVTAAAMLMFITLETLISMNSKEGFGKTTKEYDCVTTREGMVSENDSPASEAITMRCMKISRGNVYSFYNGNYSIVDGSIQCEKDAVYEYTPADMISNQSLSDAVIKCASGICIAVKANRNRIFISEPLSEGFHNVQTRNVSFLVTKIAFNPTPIMEDIASKLAELYQFPVTDELQQRRLLLLRASDTTCESTFEDQKQQVTKISTWILVLVLIVWVLSLILVMLSCFVRKYIFYDMRQTWDCVTKTYNVPARNFGSNFYIKSDLHADIHHIYVVNSPAEDDCNEFELSMNTKLEPGQTNDLLH